MSIKSTTRTVIRRTRVRNAFVATAIALSGCALDPQGGYRPAAQVSGSAERPTSFDEANARCWTASMNIAGYAASVPELEAYRACMARAGWEDQRTLF
jgi:hypothetical protein